MISAKYANENSIKLRVSLSFIVILLSNDSGEMLESELFYKLDSSRFLRKREISKHFDFAMKLLTFSSRAGICSYGVSERGMKLFRIASRNLRANDEDALEKITQWLIEAR